jgi:Cu/Ag efflux protein CusF
MRTLLVGVAAAGLVTAVTSANAQQSSTTAQGSTATQAPSVPPSATQAPSSQSPTATQAPSSQTGTTASANQELAKKELAGKELSGVVKKIDKDKRSLKLSSPAGVEQDVKIAASATITRDGAQAGLDQLKEGDDVRASFDPSSNQATKLDVQSKSMTEKDKGKSEMKSSTSTKTKTENK